MDIVTDIHRPTHRVQAEIAATDGCRSAKTQRIAIARRVLFAAVEGNIERHGLCDVSDREQSCDAAGIKTDGPFNSPVRRSLGVSTLLVSIVIERELRSG
jgi:hypothetical protein